MMRRPARLALWLVFCPIAKGQDWPRSFQPTKGSDEIKQISGSHDGFRYETNSYQIRSAIKLDSAQLSNFAFSAESVAAVMKKIPIPLFAPPAEGKPLIQIAADENSYRAAGGAPGTAGYYDGRRSRVIVRWDQLNRTPGSPKLIPRPAFDLLVHELTHLCMGQSLWKMEPWLFEGTAEYFAAAHLAKGRFDFTRIESHIRDHIRKLTPPKGQQVEVMKIAKLIKMNQRDWLSRTAKLPPEEVLQSYTSSLLLTHYAFHGGVERRNKVRSYFESLKKIKYTNEEKPVLFQESKASEIETRLKAYWSKKGLNLLFR